MRCEMMRYACADVNNITASHVSLCLMSCATCVVYCMHTGRSDMIL